MGNSRFSWVNIAGPLSQRKLVSQLCGCPSSAPEGKIKKKFGRRLSQSTLRALLTFALNSRVSPVKVTVSPIFIPSRCASPSSIDTSPGFGGQLPATSGL